MTAPRFSATISLGNVISFLALIATIFLSWQNLATAEARLEERLVALYIRLDNDERTIAEWSKDHDRIMRLTYDIESIITPRKVP